MCRLQRAGEYLRFESRLPGNMRELTIWRLNGYYITLSMIMNMARTPLPPRNKPALKGFPR